MRCAGGKAKDRLVLGREQTQKRPGTTRTAHILRFFAFQGNANAGMIRDAIWAYHRSTHPSEHPPQTLGQRGGRFGNLALDVLLPAVHVVAEVLAGGLLQR